MRSRSVFAETDVPLTGEKAWDGVLAPYWEKIVEAFDRAGHGAPGKVRRVRMDPEWHDTCRHFAGASTDGRVLVLAPELAEMPPENIMGILAHEAGHFVDFDNPGRYWFRVACQVRLRDCARAVSVKDVPDTPSARSEPALFFFEQLPVAGVAKHMREWDARCSDEVERVADAIAEHVLGVRIGYVGPGSCLIEALGRGIDRPIGLK